MMLSRQQARASQTKRVAVRDPSTVLRAILLDRGEAMGS